MGTGANSSPEVESFGLKTHAVYAIFGWKYNSVFGYSGVGGSRKGKGDVEN